MPEFPEAGNTSGSPVVTPLKPKSPPSPQLKIEPASEWTNSTLSALDSTDHAAQTPVFTPGPDLPGAYPYTPNTLEPGPSFEEVRDTAREYLQAASQYVPTQEDFKKAAQNAGSTIRGYFPDGVVTYLGPSHRQEAVTASPIDESETTPTTGDGFVLLNRGTRRTNDQTQGNHDVQHDSINNSDPIPGEMFDTTHSENPEMNGRPKSGSTHLNATLASSLGNGKASDDASTRTQPGSRTISERDTEGVPTPYSYTGRSIGGTSLRGQGDSEVRTTATHGPNHEGHTNVTGKPHPEMNDHPNGVINNGGVKVELHQGGEGVLTAPDSGTAAEPGPGPGITGRQTIFKEDFKQREGGDNSRQFGSWDSAELDGSPQHRGVEKSGSKPKMNKKMDNVTVNTAPRTHPLGKEGTQWKGVPLEEQYQAALDRNEDRGLAIGESQPPTISNAKPGTIPRDPLMKSSLRVVNSSTATTGHEGVSGSSVVANSNPGHSSPHPGGKPSRVNEKSRDQPRPASPMTAEENPHVGRATSGPNSKKLREPSNGSAEGEQSRGRRRGNFLNKIKTWSKRLSQERKAKN